MASETPSQTPDFPGNLLPPEQMNLPLWKSLAHELRDFFAPEKLPPLRLSSRPAHVGMLLGDQLSVAWYRTIFANVGDVLSPEVLPPLELDSLPEDVGELIGDQLSHLWFTSLLRNLADRFVPERLPALQITSKPEDTILPSQVMLLPKWSSVIETPRVPLPVPTKAAAQAVPRPVVPSTAPLPQPVIAEIEFLHVMENDLKRDLSRSTLRARIWTAVALAQIAFLIGTMFWPR